MKTQTKLPDIPPTIALDRSTIEQRVKALTMEADSIFIDSAIRQDEFDEWVRSLNRWAEACHCAKF